MKGQFPIEKFSALQTPFYYYDTRILRQTLETIRQEVGKMDNAVVHYAIKANANPQVLRTIREYGLGADCVSGGEIKAALQAGFAPDKIVFAGVGKADWEINLGLEHGIFCFNVESIPELEIINELAATKGVVAQVEFRVNPDVKAHTHANITTGLAENKFGIALGDIEKVIEINNYCHKFTKKDYSKGEVITSYIEKRKQIFILVSGEAALIRFDEKGNKDIVDFFREGSVFGEAFYNVFLNSELSVVATKKCSAYSIMYDDIERRCDNRCKYHESLISMLLKLLFDTTTHLNSRIEVMSKRTIREKLLIYFETLSIENYSSRVTLPFSLTDLADFLSVNRSAMMRELKTLEEDQILQKINSKTYKLLYR